MFGDLPVGEVFTEYWWLFVIVGIMGIYVFNAAFGMVMTALVSILLVIGIAVPSINHYMETRPKTVVKNAPDYVDQETVEYEQWLAKEVSDHYERNPIVKTEIIEMTKQPEPEHPPQEVKLTFRCDHLGRRLPSYGGMRVDNAYTCTVGGR